MDFFAVISTVLSVAAKGLGYTAVAILLLNVNSIPFLWHIRFWWRLIPLYTGVFAHGRVGYLDRWESKMRSRGSIGSRIRTRRRATPDDCDFNFHLSNSCYAKSTDQAMSAWTFDVITPVMMSGAYQALGGSHYTFVREIPIGSEYFMESRIAGWGEKWSYLVTEFIIYPKARSASKRQSSSTRSEKTPLTSASTSHGANTPAEMALPETNTKHPISGNSGQSGTSTPPDLASVAMSVLRNPKPRSDGGVIAAYAVHELCFKVGRITIPPRIAFHLAGHSPNPAEQARSRSLTTNKKAAARWLAGGWRDASDAKTIGRDIAPATIECADKASERENQAETEWARRVVRGMEGVSMGLGDVVNL